jgi:diguanylate cyclase (GGDEF)-like protein
VPYALVIVVVGLTVVTSWYVASIGEARRRAEFLAEANETRHEIQIRLNAHFDLVRATAALFGANNEVNGAEFRAFVSALHLRDQYSALRGIGVAVRVRSSDLSSFQRALVLDGTSLSTGPSRPWVDDYYAVTFLEPLDGVNARAIGFDLKSDLSVRAAVERARDTGRTTVSLAAGAPFARPPGDTFLFVVPVYQRGLPLNTVAERRLALVGLVFSPFSMETILGAAGTDSSMAFTVYDGEQPGRGALLYQSVRESSPEGDRSADDLPVAGNQWHVVVATADPRPTVLAQVPVGTLAAGLLFAALLFAMTRAQTRAWEAAARHEAALRRVALHDPLTTLPNRAFLDDLLARAIAAAQRHRRRLAVLFVDVDDFKHVNDVYGHANGDQLLRSVARRLLACVRTSDTVSRHGGDEFVILLTDIDRARHAASRAQEIIHALVAPHRAGDHTITVTVSIGIAIYPDDGPNAPALLQAADTAMYQAKEHCNGYRFFNPGMNASTRFPRPPAPPDAGAISFH